MGMAIPLAKSLVILAAHGVREAHRNLPVAWGTRKFPARSRPKPFATTLAPIAQARSDPANAVPRHQLHHTPTLINMVVGRHVHAIQVQKLAVHHVNETMAQLYQTVTAAGHRPHPNHAHLALIPQKGGAGVHHVVVTLLRPAQ